MDLNEMVEELKEPLRTFAIDFVKDIYENRHKEISEETIKLFISLKDRYIKMAHLD